MGSHTRDISPDKQINDLLSNPDKYLSTDEGLPDELKATLLRRGKAGIFSSLDEGKQNLTEKLAGSSSGGTPIDAVIRGNTMLQDDANDSLVNLEEDVAMKDYDANQANKDRLLNIYKTRLQGLFGQQQFGSEDEARNKGFDAGDAIGAVIGGGSAVASGGISRK